MANETLTKYISSFVKLSDADIALISSFFKYEEFPKGSILEKENAITRNLYFIERGFVRTFCYENGQEVTTQIVGANNLITNFKSFVAGITARENVKCITDCRVFYISKQDYDQLTLTSSSWEIFCKKSYERIIASNLQRTKDLLTLSADKRYLKLLNDYPEIIQHVPIQYIASYIGIKPESLSRIRKKIIS